MTIATTERTVIQADFRQLRHHTKNALASILAQLSRGLRSTTPLAGLRRIWSGGSC